MPEILIAIDAEIDDSGEPISASPAISGMVKALKGAIASSTPHLTARVVTANSLSVLPSDGSILCPLTLNLPDTLPFPGQLVYNACRDVQGLRQRVEHLGYATGEGNFWLPIVLTAKGPLYGEVISSTVNSTALSLNSPILKQGVGLGEKIDCLAGENIIYRQPMHLGDNMRQQLYQMGYKLVRSLNAPEATYLMQFGLQKLSLYFDRLWPFPAAPALASLGVQKPDLFTCHLYCLTNRPLFDLRIDRTSAYQVNE